MDHESTFTAVGQAVQLSVAPVFLLSAIGAILGVMANRLARIVDRGRQIEARLVGASPAEETRLRTELGLLTRRVSLTYRSIALCTITALFVCALVVTLFVGAFLQFRAAVAVAVLFVAAMTTFFAGLLLFLREVFLAVETLRHEKFSHRLAHGAPAGGGPARGAGGNDAGGRPGAPA